MATPVTMPMLGLTMEEGTVAEWLKAEGDSVARDEPLLTVEMDKGTVEVPSPTSGVLARIVVPVGTTVPVKALIAEIAAPGEVLAPAGGPGDLPSKAAAPSDRAMATAATPPAAVASAPSAGQRLFASPRARLRARENGVDLTSLRGSGPHGRIVEADVLAASSETRVRT